RLYHFGAYAQNCGRNSSTKQPFCGTFSTTAQAYSREAVEASTRSAIGKPFGGWVGACTATVCESISV
ncbi:MAG: hypothetical protein WAQ73_07615, partial [Bacillota bacterium]